MASHRSADAGRTFYRGDASARGKSLLGLTLAKSVATGTAFLDRPVTQGSVIYINLEDSPTKIKTRQQRQGWAEGLPVYWLDKFKLSELDHLRELADEIDDLRLVVIDTFSRARDDAQKESSAELGKILEPLQEWAKERGICLLLTHHTGKANTDHPSADPFDSLRGSTSIRATCRGAIVIIPAEQSYRLIAENGFSDRLDIAVHINPQTLEWRLNGQWLPRVDGDMKQQILDHLNLHGEATVAEIAAALKFNSASVSTVMSRLHRDDMVSKRGGKGRSPALYTRSSNLLKQQTTEFEHPNPEPARNTALLKQNNLYGDSPEKVINGAKSDQCVDHFEKNAPTHIYLFEQSQELDGVSILCSNSTTSEFEQIGSTGTETERQNNYTPPEVGTKVRYVGQNWQKQKALSRKHLTVIATTTNDEGHWVTVEHPDLMVSQTIAVSEVKLIQS
ncbi:MAG: AAA family ATPase [Synechococcales cyanobacterium CRU_2_2]|nr:AAA family ATPase [Synechococcales cyanobacterium CRU_2_2]